MKIEDSRIDQTITFDCLAWGDTFVDSDEDVFMKMESACSSKNGELYNAVYLKSGEITHFDSDEKVRTIKAKVVIG